MTKMMAGNQEPEGGDGVLFGSRELSGVLPIPPQPLDATEVVAELPTPQDVGDVLVEDPAHDVQLCEPERSYYEILGLQPVCDQDAVRKAYKTRAKVVHPDKRCGGGMEADEFRAITEAYAALSDPARRAEYDKGGKEALRRYDAEQGEELLLKKRKKEDKAETMGLLERIFAPLSKTPELSSVNLPATQTVPPESAGVIEKPLLVTLEELALGTTKRFKVASSSGSPSGGQALQVQIQPGWAEGTRLMFPGMGGKAPGRPDSGMRDLVFVLKEAPHDFYRRDGDNLVTEVPVPLVTALCGGNLQLPNFAGRPLLSVNIQHGANLDNPLVISGAGMPRPDGTKGDLRVTFKVVLPVGLTDAQRDRLQQVLLDVDSVII